MLIASWFACSTTLDEAAMRLAQAEDPDFAHMHHLLTRTLFFYQSELPVPLMHTWERRHPGATSEFSTQQNW
jgi:hypothetical protein